MLKGVLLATAAIVALPAVGMAQDRLPVSGKTCEELATLYENLPFTDRLPLAEGPIEVDGEVRNITIGFSQTAFNHPWRVSMLESLQAEACRHDNLEIIVLDGNVDVAKQNNDVRDLIARGVDAVVMSPVESAALVPAARAVRAEGLPLIVLDRDVPTEKTLFIGQSNVTMGEQVARKMVEDLGGEGKIVVITGLQGSSPAIDRDAGMKNVLADHPGIEVLAVGDGQWIREPAVPMPYSPMLKSRHGVLNWP
jgi:ribose transport system substrate-binding protein